MVRTADMADEHEQPEREWDEYEWERPAESEQDAFMAVLRRGGVAATLRREKGHDIAAACGQLRRQTRAEAGPGGA